MNLKSFIVKRQLKRLVICIFILLVFIIGYDSYHVENFSTGFSRIHNLLLRMYPLDFTIIKELYPPIIETINIALFSSVLALITALFLLPILTNILFKFKIIPKVISGVFAIFRTIPFLIIKFI